MQDSINKIRRYDIDLLKFIACIMVVILHGIVKWSTVYSSV